MKKTKQKKAAKGAAGKTSERVRDEDPISAYAREQPLPLRRVCRLLREAIDAALPEATSRIWHGAPVWFRDEHPVVGISTTAREVKLLFWNGQALDEPELEPVGKFRAAQARFSHVDEVDERVLRRRLKKAGANVLDSKALAKEMRERS